MVYLFGLAALASTYLGGLFTLKYRDKLHRILGFASGVLLGAVFFDLLPEAFEMKGAHNLTQVTLPLVAGFLLYHVLQRLFFLHSCLEEGQGDLPHHHTARLGAGAFIIHSFFDGLAIGVSFQAGYAIGLLVSLAVIAHDFSDGLNTVSLLLRHKMGHQKVKLWLLADAVAPLMGIAVAQVIYLPKTILASILSIFAGFFLYISTADLLPETHHEHHQGQTVAATVAGAVLMFIITHLLR